MGDKQPDCLTLIARVRNGDEWDEVVVSSDVEIHFDVWTEYYEYFPSASKSWDLHEIADWIIGRFDPHALVYKYSNILPPLRDDDGAAYTWALQQAGWLRLLESWCDPRHDCLAVSVDSA